MLDLDQGQYKSKSSPSLQRILLCLIASRVVSIRTHRCQLVYFHPKRVVIAGSAIWEIANLRSALGMGMDMGMDMGMGIAKEN